MTNSLAAAVAIALFAQTSDPTGLVLRSRAEPGSEAAEPAAASDGGDVDAALAEGDLDEALSRARSAREAEPTASRWVDEARVLQARGELVAAKEAYSAALAAEGVDALDVSAVEANIERLDEQSRGRVPEEPASTHREALDAERAQRLAPPEPEPEPEPAPPPKKDVKVVDKWYFWVTLAAIVASAGAITGIAIKAASDERKDALDRSAMAPGLQGAPGSAAILRF